MRAYSFCKWRHSSEKKNKKMANKSSQRLTNSATFSNPGSVVKYPVLRMMADDPVLVVVVVTRTVWACDMAELVRYFLLLSLIRLGEFKKRLYNCDGEGPIHFCWRSSICFTPKPNERNEKWVNVRNFILFMVGFWGWVFIFCFWFLDGNEFRQFWRGNRECFLF